MVLSFGKHIALTYPRVADFVRYYHEHKDAIEFDLKNAELFKRLKKELSNLEHNLKILEQCVDPYNRYCTDSVHYLLKLTHIKREWVGIPAGVYSYTVHDALTFVMQQIDMHMTRLDLITPLVKKEALSAIKHVCNGVVFDELSFMDALEHYGDKHDAIWKHQSILPDMYVKYISSVEVPCYAHEDLDENTFVYLGLLGASDYISALQFAKVPVGVSWRIIQYDGKETVKVD
jgi:hypothetical protein